MLKKHFAADGGDPANQKKKSQILGWEVHSSMTLRPNRIDQCLLKGSITTVVFQQNFLTSSRKTRIRQVTPPWTTYCYFWATLHIFHVHMLHVYYINRCLYACMCVCMDTHVYTPIYEKHAKTSPQSNSEKRVNTKTHLNNRPKWGRSIRRCNHLWS